MRESSAAPRLDIAGRDAPLPRFLRGPRHVPEAPRWDSVVVRGTGIGALLCAGRLARSQSLAGRVTIAGPHVRETRRLIGGLTLRARSFDYYAAALGCSHESLLREIFPRDIDQTEMTSQSACTGRWRDGRFELMRSAEFMRSSDYGGGVLAYAPRNSQLVAALERVVEKLDLVWHEEMPDTLDECRDLARGSRPLIIDAATRPLTETKPPPALDQVLLGTQLYFTDPEREAVGRLARNAGVLGIVGHERGVDISFFSPVADPLSPDARWYGGLFALASGGSTEDRAEELARSRDIIVQLGAVHGLEPHDEHETLGEAVVPCQSWEPPRTVFDDVVPLRRIYTCGAPAITGDGMTRAGLAAWVVAESILAGEDPVRHANRSERKWRRANRQMASNLTRGAKLFFLVCRYLPPGIFALGQTDMWAAVRRGA